MPLSRKRSLSPKRSPRKSSPRRSPKSMTVQSIAFPKNWKRSHITSWLRNHNYHPIKEDSTVNFIRFRILPPHRNAIFATKILPNDIHLIMMRDY
uniref:Uncharacterized protein n=1 Tax=Iridovirus sp. TaxID=135728 RepID=A0AAU7YCS7_9VIRU